VSTTTLILPSLSHVILSSRHLLLLVYLASTSRSLPRHPRFGNRWGDANRLPTTMSRLLATTRRSTRCSGRPMSILSDTLTRYYMTKYTFLSFFFFWRNETLRSGNLRRASSRNRARPRERSHAISSRASLPGHYFDRLSRDQSFLITPKNSAFPSYAVQHARNHLGTRIRSPD